MAQEYKYVRADSLSFDPREQISRIFVEGFYQWLHFFSKDKELLSRALAHTFELGKFYVGADRETVAAITACTDGKHPSIHLDKHELRRHLGFLRGSFAYVMLYKYLENHPYPFTLSESTGSIEFVATAAKYQRQGVASALIEHIMSNTPYTDYVLEVADTNTAALRLYERLGFAEVKRIPEKHPKQSGLNFYIYMRKSGA
jgi:ribosomal protein S18 acetylase RimI-like enzyme